MTVRVIPEEANARAPVTASEVVEPERGREHPIGILHHEPSDDEYHVTTFVIALRILEPSAHWRAGTGALKRVLIAADGGSVPDQLDGPDSAGAQVACTWCGLPALRAFAAEVRLRSSEGELVYHFHETCLILGAS